MLFSAGAYVLGSGLNATDLPNTMVNAAFNSMGITSDTPFWVLYVILTFLMMYSGLVFQSKTIRTMVFVPIALGVEKRFGFPPMSLSLPVAMLIEHCYVLPFNSKPAALLYNTNQYSMTDAFKYGMPPHGGWGIGIERLLVKMLDLPNIREAILFPRDPSRLSP